MRDRLINHRACNDFFFCNRWTALIKIYKKSIRRLLDNESSLTNHIRLSKILV